MSDDAETKLWSHLLNTSKTVSDHKAATQILVTIQKLTFGTSPEHKEHAVVSGRAFDIIYNVYERLETTKSSDELLLQINKSIRNCVISSPVGRSQCRRFMIMKLLRDTLRKELEKISDNKSKGGVLLEDILTTVAAVCMNDELNAIWVYAEMRLLLERCQTDCMHMSSGIQQKTSYFTNLLQAVKADVEVAAISVDMQQFFEYLSQAEEAKEGGNALFSKNKYEAASDKYTLAIDVLENEASSELSSTKELKSKLYCNRSICMTQLENFTRALEDAEKALQYNPGWVKAIYRKFLSQKSLNLMDEARETLAKGLVIDPTNETFKKESQELL